MNSETIISLALVSSIAAVGYIIQRKKPQTNWTYFSPGNVDRFIRYPVYDDNNKPNNIKMK